MTLISFLLVSSVSAQQPVRLEIIREKKISTEAQIKDLLDPVKLSGLDKASTRRTSSERRRIGTQKAHGSGYYTFRRQGGN